MTAAACSLTTSLSGLTSGDPAAPATDSGVLDSPVTGLDGGGGSEASAGDGGGAGGYRALVLADSPLAYYRLGDTGTVAKDEVGGHDGSYVGPIAHAAGAIAGEPDTAAVFDGTSSYVDVANAPGFADNAPFTLEAWVSQGAAASDPMCIAAKTLAPGGASGNVSDGYTFYLSAPDNTLALARFTNSVDETAVGPPLTQGRFSHVVGTYDGARLVVYVDGERVGELASTKPLASVPRHLTIGAGRGGVYCYFRGALDEMALYGAPLPLDRIRAHHRVGAGLAN